MSKILKIFLTIVVFVIGLSVGMYYGVSRNDIKEIEEKKPIDSIQDVVIKKVQSENKIKEEEDSGDKIEVLAEEERISPYAKMIIEKKFSKCGHTTYSCLDVPKELINLTKEELEKKYSGWDVKEFSKDEFTLYRLIEANCEDYYVLKQEDDYKAVYNEITEEISNLVKKTEIDVSLLREEDRFDLAEGIKIYGKEELTSLMEDFDS